MNPTSPLQLEIIEISQYKASKLNALWHSRLPIFETGFCQNAKVCYGAVHDNIFYAVAIWSNPVARLLPQDKWLELRRMAISEDAPKYTASRMLAIMVHLIKKRFPRICKLISYQDVKVHTGTIYRASGWKEGRHHGGGSWNRPNLKNTYTKTSRTRPDFNAAIGPKIRWEKDIF